MRVTAAFCLSAMFGISGAAVAASDPQLSLPVSTRQISELKPLTVVHLGKTADWVVVTDEAVWVASTGPFAVSRIDPRTNRVVAIVPVNGEPCAGLATGFGSLWVPLCTVPATLARIDLSRNVVTAVLPVGPAAKEGGITAGTDSVWLVTDVAGTLARIDPNSSKVRQTVQLPAGSYNPLAVAGRIWVTHAAGREVTGIEEKTGRIWGTVTTGPGPRFLTAGGDSVWTLNQGDGTVTRIDAHSGKVLASVALGTPGHGGDINSGGGYVWTTMPKVPLSAISLVDPALVCQWVGPGGDSMGIGHGAIWLTDYTGGTVSRIDLADAARRCHPPGAAAGE